MEYYCPLPANPDLPILANQIVSASTADRICGTSVIPGCDKESTAVVLVLAHLTGWSAELIANKANDHFYAWITPEHVWDIYRHWVSENGKHPNIQPLDVLELHQEISMILKAFGAKVVQTETKLDQRPRPITAAYADVWYPGGTGEPDTADQKPKPPLFSGFDMEARRRCVTRLSSRATEDNLSDLVLEEENILAQLGPHVEKMIKRVLEQWILDTVENIKRMPFSRTVYDAPELWTGIAYYGMAFKREWEMVFGTMHSIQPSSYVSFNKGKIPIVVPSTGAAAQILLCMLLVNRLNALDVRRQTWRELAGFVDVALEDLPKDSECCVICRDTLGKPNEDGEIETPIQIVSCCGNYFGKGCLTKWYTDFGNEKCPLCKAIVSRTLLAKLRDDQERDRQAKRMLEQMRRLDIDLDAWDSGITPDSPEQRSTSSSQCLSNN